MVPAPSFFEELVVAFVYSNARERCYYDKYYISTPKMLATIKRIVSHFRSRKPKAISDWESNIVKGYAVYRHLLKKREAVLHLDLHNHDLVIVK